uniref:non-specific serine/threonine protein kinase n=1 Tax=Leersia perrieri TaxID=77586 RepID=A0A0D9XV76_9ORYZ
MASEAASMAAELIMKIVEAAKTARQNKKTCVELAQLVEQVGELLRALQEQPGVTVMERPETRAPLMELEETLRQAYELVESCRRGSYLRRFCAGKDQAGSLRDVQSRISIYLQLFPIRDEDEMLMSLTNRCPRGQARSLSLPLFQKFSFSQLAHATNYFSLDAQLEQGTLAILYKFIWPGVSFNLFNTPFQGKLHGNDVTIKRLSVSTSGPASARSMLDWSRRFRIIEGIAHGVAYLHNYSRVRVVHRDLKPSNILLDSDMNPKISNFELADMLSLGTDEQKTDNVAGSIGFSAPEYMHEGIFSVKTDVYSFGIMVLEIISGKRWTQHNQIRFYRDLLTWIVE